MRPFQVLIIFIFLISTPLFGETYPHPNISYNKALEYYQKEDLGLAMLHAKRAMLLSPAQPDIRKLFYTIRKDIGLPQIYSSDNLGTQIISRAFAQTPPHISALLGGILFLTGSVFSAILLLKKVTKHKNIVIIALWSAFIGAGTCFLQSYILYDHYFLLDQRIVLVQIPAYEEASLESTHLLDLPAGTEVKVMLQDQDFSLVRVLDGKEYWIITKNIPSTW